MRTLKDRIRVQYFEGTKYWEVLVDDKVVHTTQTQEDADLFMAKLLLEGGK